MGWLKPSAITPPAPTTTAPMGTSPARSASRACARARRMKPSWPAGLAIRVLRSRIRSGSRITMAAEGRNEATPAGRGRALAVVSGGQTGVDRAALDAALELGLPCGGWCPRGRRAEDGALDPRYPLIETPLEDYWQRTEWNVRDSDG